MSYNKWNLSKSELENLYLTQELSTRKIAKIQNVSACTVARWIKKYNIKIRNKSEAVSGIKNPMFGKIHYLF